MKIEYYPNEKKMALVGENGRENTILYSLNREIGNGRKILVKGIMHGDKFVLSYEGPNTSQE